jgi:hypothetical protein
MEVSALVISHAKDLCLPLPGLDFHTLRGSDRVGVYVGACGS